jgi:hypothetical protein
LTGHVSGRTATLLDEWATREHQHQPVGVANTRHGWLLTVLPQDCGHPDIPADLAEVLAFTQGEGRSVLLLDSDGAPTERLPFFDW